MHAILTLVLFFPQVAQSQLMTVANTYTSIEQGQFEWTVFIKENPVALATIQCVEYTLHPTFPNPVRTVCDRQNGFALKTQGWGEFTIYLKIQWNDGTATHQSYQLDLHSVTLPEPDAIQVRNTAAKRPNGESDWTMFVVAPVKQLEEIQCVEYTLHPSFQKPVRKVCERGSRSDQAFSTVIAGWETFDVGVKVMLRSGRSLFLKHTLTSHAIALKLGPSSEWKPDYGEVSAVCEPPNPHEKQFAEVKTIGGPGVMLRSESRGGACCTCVRRSRSFPLGGAMNSDKVSLQGWFEATRGLKDTFSLSSMQVDLYRAGQRVSFDVYAGESRKNNNCAQTGARLLRSAAPFDIPLSTIRPNTEFDEIRIHLQGYGCMNATNTVAVSDLRVVF